MIPSKETDHVGTGKALLLEQFKGRPVINGFLGVFMRRAQAIEDAFWDIIDKRILDTAADAQLDSLGGIVGEKRLGRGDDEYRQAIKLRVRVNRSKGRTVDVLDVAILAASPGKPRYVEYPTLQFEVGIYDKPAERYVAELLSKTRAICSYGILVASDLPFESVLAFDDDNTPLGVETFSDHESGAGLVAASGYGLPSDFTGITWSGADAPTVTSVSPTSGGTAGGDALTITGTDFVSGATVTIGGVAATSVVFVSATQLTCVTPAGTAGAKDVVVTNPDTQTGTLVGGFTYSAASAPTLSALSYAIGDVLGGGESIVLTGSGFTTATDVKFGTTSATFTVDSDTQITATLPAHAAGSVSVTVVGPGGTSAGQPFEFWPPTADPAVTLLLESLASPYDAGTGIWTPRYSLVGGANLTNGTATHHAASSGAPVFDGNAAGEGGLLQAGGPTWASYLGADTGSGECAGAIAAVFSSTNNNALDLVTAPYDNPQVVGNENLSSGTTGVGFGVASPGGTPTECVYAHSYHGAGYLAQAVPATPGALHAVVSRWGTGVDSFDLSVDGATAGAGYASTPTTVGASTAFTAYPISLGLSYPDSATTSQIFAGTAKAVCVLNAKASDSFVTKFYQWSRQRFGVA